MNEQTYTITFDNVSPDDANLYAEELKNAVLDATPDVVVQRKRGDPRAQDFGATLILILGAPATVAVANAIGNWLKMRSNASLTFKTADENILVQNITSKDAVRLVELLQTKK